MKKNKTQSKKPARTPIAKRKSSSVKRSTLQRGSKLAEIKAFSKHLLRDYALPLKRMVESKISKLQHRWA